MRGHYVQEGPDGEIPQAADENEARLPPRACVSFRRLMTVR